MSQRLPCKQQTTEQLKMETGFTARDCNLKALAEDQQAPW